MSKKQRDSNILVLDRLRVKIVGSGRT